MSNGEILIVDDSRSVLSFLSTQLKAASYSISTAENGQEAWELVEKGNIDLILSDLEMPVMDGFELCHLIKQHEEYRHMYFILLSTRKTIEDKVKGLSVGADDYIVKSTPKEELLARINAGMRVRRLQQELKQTQSYIYQQEKMASIGQLAAGVAHEINNPIGFVTSNLATLKKYNERLCHYINAVSSEIKEGSQKEMAQLYKKYKIGFVQDDANDLINESLEGTVRVTKIVQGLKSFSRVDEAESKPVDLNECLKSTLNIVYNELKYTTTVHEEYGDLPLTRCYAQQLNQVFMNLLVNAGQAIEDKGEITIRSWSENAFIYISISDTGCGIEPENINRLFEPFFTTKDVGKGTGLGLSISYHIVRKHEGCLTVKSKPGKGTTFTVSIPVKN